MVRKIGRVVRQYEGKPIIYGMPLEELTAWFEEKGEKEIQSRTIMGLALPQTCN